MRRLKSAAIATLLVGLLVGCSDGSSPTDGGDTGAPTGPDGGAPAAEDQLSSAEVESLLIELELQLEEIVESDVTTSMASVQPSEVSLFGDPPGPGSLEMDILLTRECFAGGELVIDGHVVRLLEEDPWYLTIDLEGTRTYAACGMPVGRHGEGLPPEYEGEILTIDGELAMTMHRERTFEMWFGVQAATVAGSLSWERSTGESGSCDIDLSADYDPVAGTRTVTGTACGETIDRVFSWPPTENSSWGGSGG
ncbi:MAG: hypothetical protein R6X22_11725 [Gemmatimonadota bacterium]